MEIFMIKQLETQEEINGMGFVLCQSWHETYTGLIDQEYLNQITVEKGVKIAAAQKNHAMIALVDNQVIGLVGYGPYRDEDNLKVGEIYAIYVLAQYQGEKVGYHLMNAAVEQLSNYQKIVLWVLQGNDRAIRFYEKYGFRFDGMEKKILMGTEQTELRMILERTER